MGFSQAIKTCFRKYFTFSGRAPRSEFWYFVLFLFLGQLVAILVNSILFGPEIRVDPNTGQVVGRSYTEGRIGDVFFLATVVPHVAVGWRRMHDISKPGWLPYALYLGVIILFAIVMVAINGFSQTLTDLAETGNTSAQIGSGYVTAILLLALLASIVMSLIWLCSRSTPGPNRYGPNPFDPANTADLPEVFE